ncbi:hypothetical protein [Ruminococcus sp.]|uniref:hypothetical protein n=1 Tax=Ruminococcus sp. TaxID=41978 RepID=UPI002E793064|nr:hypothetical protein [Ruminococcus sp.]MEE1261599.1 hypothetical protein [Ruminococcus sp.]
MHNKLEKSIDEKIVLKISLAKTNTEIHETSARMTQNRINKPFSENPMALSSIFSFEEHSQVAKHFLIRMQENKTHITTLQIMFIMFFSICIFFNIIIINIAKILPIIQFRIILLVLAADNINQNDTEDKNINTYFTFFFKKSPLSLYIE